MSNADDDLEALFDSIANTNAPVAPEAVAAAAPAAEVVVAAASAVPSGDIYAQIGQTTRKLHDTLRDIGHDKLPAMSDKVRGAIDAVKPMQDALENGAAQLSAKWQQLMDGKLSVDEFKTLAGETKTYLQDVPSKTKASNSQLMDIPDAQAIKKLTEAMQGLEGQLVQLLVANAPEAKKKELGDASTPDQVKALLGNLGF